MMRPIAELGLEAIHVEWLEQTPPTAGPRVRHFVDQRDVTDIHPSCDLWGAGGLVANAHDLAAWWHAPFAGNVFDQPASIERMLRTVPEPDAARRRASPKGRDAVADDLSIVLRSVAYERSPTMLVSAPPRRRHQTPSGR